MAELQPKYGFEVETLSTINPFKRLVMPRFPAVEIDGEIVFEDRGITASELEAEIQKRLPGTKA